MALTSGSVFLFLVLFSHFFTFGGLFSLVDARISASLEAPKRIDRLIIILKCWVFFS